MYTKIYIPPSDSIQYCSYVYVFRADHVGLVNLLVLLSLEKTDSSLSATIIYL